MAEQVTHIYQFSPQLDLPIFIQIDDEEMQDGLKDLLHSCYFSKLEVKEGNDVIESLGTIRHARVLKISLASSRIQSQITMAQQNDAYGHESLTPNNGYTVYRYKSLALMVYSFSHNTWELGVLEHFADPQWEGQARAVLNRYLGWTLSVFGFAGFWGQIYNKKYNILKSNEALGHAFYINPNTNVVIGDTTHGHASSYTFVRPMKLNGPGSKKMTSEELLAFLSTRTTYFGLQGLTVPVRQIIQMLCQKGVGEFINQDEGIYYNLSL